MRQSPGMFLALFVSLAVPIRVMATPDSKLISLVPPGAPVVAGMDTPNRRDQPSSFVFMTHDNGLDLRDFLALTGVDSRREINHALFVAMDNQGHLDEHSLLVSGRFDVPWIFRSAEQGGAALTHYRGFEVLIVEPFARERGEIRDVRWLAVLDSNLLLFGSISIVTQEIGRYIEKSAPDPALLQKLAWLRHDDETWCLLSVPAGTPEIRSALMALDTHLANLAADGDAFQFGIRFRKQVEFEYAVTTASAAASQSISASLMHALAGPEKGIALLDSPTADAHIVRGRIRIPATRFAAWLEKSSQLQLASR